MTNNTIPNVPRELLENTLNKMSIVWQSTDEMDQLRAILSAQSPTGVDGLEVVAWRIGFPNNSGYKVYEQRQPWAYEQYGVPSVIAYEVQELCRLSDATAIIDGLRGEVERLDRESQNLSNQLGACSRDRNMFRTERDQQAQRIGELEGLLRMAVVALKDYAVSAEGEWGCGKSWEEMVESKDSSTTLPLEMDAALSAGKDSAS